MRILIISPESNLDTIAEIRRIQQWHDVALLHGTVTVEDVYRALGDKAYDSVYFATHGGPDGIVLSDGNMMSAEDIAQAARQRETPGLFFAACQTGRLASYCVRHGVRYAISSEIDLPDAAAWKLAATFYGHLRNGQSKDFVGAYVLADSGDGEYALHISPAYIQQLQAAAVANLPRPHDSVMLSRRGLIWLLVGMFGANAALSALINILAGRL